MITVNLINISYYAKLQFFFVMRSFKIYFLSNLKIFNVILLTIFTMLYITPHDQFILYLDIILLDSLHPLSIASTLRPSGKHQSFLYKFCFVCSFALLKSTPHIVEIIWYVSLCDLFP